MSNGGSMRGRTQWACDRFEISISHCGNALPLYVAVRLLTLIWLHQHVIQANSGILVLLWRKWFSPRRYIENQNIAKWLKTWYARFCRVSTSVVTTTRPINLSNRINKNDKPWTGANGELCQHHHRQPTTTNNSNQHQRQQYWQTWDRNYQRGSHSLATPRGSSGLVVESLVGCEEDLVKFYKKMTAGASGIRKDGCWSK